MADVWARSNSSESHREYVAARHAKAPVRRKPVDRKIRSGEEGKGRQQSPSTTPIGLGGAQDLLRRRGGRGGRAAGGGGRAAAWPAGACSRGCGGGGGAATMSPYVVEKRRGGSDRDRRLRPKPRLKRT